MRCRSALAALVALAAAACVAACAANPDPRPRGPDEAAHDGLGGWAVARLTDGVTISGELIATEPALYILARFPAHRPVLVSRPRSAIRRLDVYTYHADLLPLAGLGALGTASTISNGWFLVITGSAWILTTSIAGVFESLTVLVRYPDKPWSELAKWARFPQGMPPGMITTRDLMPHGP